MILKKEAGDILISFSTEPTSMLKCREQNVQNKECCW